MQAENSSNDNCSKLYKSMSASYWLIRICGISVFEIPLGRPRRKLSLLYTLSLWTAYGLASRYTLARLAFKRDSIAFVLVIHLIVLLMNFAMLMITTICRALSYKSIKGLLEAVAAIDENLESLGIEIHYEQHRRRNTRILILWLLMWSVKFLCGLYNFSAFFDPVQDLAVNLLLQIPQQFNSTVEIGFVVLVLTLGERFKYINEVTRGLTKAAALDDYEINSEDDEQQQENPSDLECILTNVRQLHLELSAIIRNVNGIFSVYLAMLMGSFFVYMIGYLYSLYLLHTAPALVIAEQLRHFVGHAPPILLGVARLIYIINACESVAAEALSTSRIAHEIELSGVQAEMSCEIEQLSLQILQHPLVFKTFGSVIVNFSLLQGFVGTISSYLIILIQNEPYFARASVNAMTWYFGSRNSSGELEN